MFVFMPTTSSSDASKINPELTLNSRLADSKTLPLDEHQPVLIQTNCISVPYMTIGTAHTPIMFVFYAHKVVI
jgi:hypothetical protein